VTAAQFAVPLYILLIDNGLYEVTGGQAVANAGRTNFAAIARGAGIPRVYECADRSEWEARADESLTGSGPVFVWLRVRGELGKATPTAPRPMAEQVARLRAALGEPRQ
jgi:thiamine pyrophosphate-dependent acetolactate synthase large subunit-like protein